MPAHRDTFQQVVRTFELQTRLGREPDHALEDSALVGLSKTLASTPRQILQALARAAFELCEAGSAGVSTLDSETGGDPSLFRWPVHGRRGTREPLYPGISAPAAWSSTLKACN
jgi:hypothetical protein